MVVRARGRYCPSNLLSTAVLFMIGFLLIRPSHSQYHDYDDYVKEVLEEDYRNAEDYDDSPYDDFDREEMLRQKQQERMEEEERLAREEASKAAREREAQFEAELSRMSAENQKAARKQKRNDAKIVKQILRAAGKENHYAVLGLRNLELKINPRPISISIGPQKITIPGFKLFHISPNKIRRAYRCRAMAVHPDKNRDGRANEAFIAVENSASILSDEKLREEYDEKLRAVRLQQKQKVVKMGRNMVNSALGAVRKSVKIFCSVLGPFAWPVFILGVLII